MSQLAATFISNNFELAPVYRQLFKSNHFFDDKALGAIVKSPYDHFVSFVNEANFTVSDEFKRNMFWYNGQIGQLIFDPTDVAGWQGNHDWINASTLIGRWQGIEWYLWVVWDNYREEVRELAIELSSATETDPGIVTQHIVDHFIATGLQTQADYDIATTVFKYQVPQNYFDNNSWNLNWDSAPYQVLLLLFHITKLPAFQLK